MAGAGSRLVLRPAEMVAIPFSVGVYSPG